MQIGRIEQLTVEMGLKGHKLDGTPMTAAEHDRFVADHQRQITEHKDVQAVERYKVEQEKGRAPNQIMKYFKYQHLPHGKLREVSSALCSIAEVMNQDLPDGPEKTTGLRKLLEAKDCFVRAALEQ